MTSTMKNRVVEVVSHSKYKKKERPSIQVGAQTSRNLEEEIKEREKEMKRLRHDVFKLAMSGLQHDKKIKVKEALAINLGARPRKNKPINYKELINQKMAAKKNTEDERKRNQKSGLKNLKNPKSRHKKRDQNDIKGFDYQVGRFKGGVQYVNKRQLKSK